MVLNEQEVLAVIRTLLAYERNYQAIERTQLAQLRTGLSLALITPPATATLAYAFDLLPKDYYISIVVYIFLGVLIIYGVWMSLHSYFELKQIRKIQKKIRDRRLGMEQKSGTIKAFLEDV